MHQVGTPQGPGARTAYRQDGTVARKQKAVRRKRNMRWLSVVSVLGAVTCSSTAPPDQASAISTTVRVRHVSVLRRTLNDDIAHDRFVVAVFTTSFDQPLFVDLPARDANLTKRTVVPLTELHRRHGHFLSGSARLVCGPHVFTTGPSGSESVHEATPPLGLMAMHEVYHHALYDILRAKEVVCDSTLHGAGGRDSGWAGFPW